MRHAARLGLLGLLSTVAAISRAQQPQAQRHDVAGWIRALASDDAGQRRAAIRSLARIGRPSLPALRATLRSRSPTTQRAAASALVRIGEPALRFAIDALLDANSIDSATWILRRIGEPAVPALLARIDQNASRRRAIVIRTLGRLGKIGLSAVPVLIAKLDDERDQAAAALALGDLAPYLGSQRAAVLDRLLQLASRWTPQTDRSWTESKATFELCVRATRSNLTFNRGSALATALGKLQPQSIEPLREMLRNGRQYSRLIAALALGSMGTVARPAVEELLLTLDDSNLDPRVVVYVVWAIGHIRSDPPRAIARLHELARHPVPLIRFNAVHAMLKLHDDPERVGKFLADEIAGHEYRARSLESIEKLLQWNVLRFTAEEQRDRPRRTKRYNEIVPREQFVIDPSPLVTALIDVLNAKVRDHRISAARILGAIGQQAAAASGALANCVANTSAPERVAALAALIRIDPDRVSAETLSDGDRVAWAPEIFHALRSLGSSASRSIPILQAAIASRHAPTRRYAVILLEDQRDCARAESILLDALGSRYDDVRTLALRSFSDSKAKRARAVARLRELLLSEHADVGGFAAHALAALGATAELLGGMGSTDARVRARIVRALADARTLPETADRLLTRALTDPSVAVRTAGVEVLRKQPALVHKVQPSLTNLLSDEEPALRIAACALVTGDAGTEIAKLLSDDNAAVASAAAHRCLELDVGAATRVRAALLVIADKRSGDWQAAARLLAANKAPPLAELGSLLSNPDGEIAGRAATTVGSLGPRAAVVVPKLTQLLGSSDAKLRRIVVQALGNLGPTAASAATALARHLDDSDRGVRVTAAIALGRLGKAAAQSLPALRKKAASNDAQLAFHAQTAVRRITDDKIP